MSDCVLDLLTGGWKARAVTTAARAGVFDALWRKPGDSAELAYRLSLHQPTLERLLRFLREAALLTIGPDGKCRLTAAGYTLVDNHPSSLRRLAELYEEQYFDAAWRALDAGLRTGGTPFTTAFGKPVFEYLAEHPQEASRYATAIGEGAPHGRLVAEQARLETPHHIVDIGGGDGRILAELLQVYTNAHGTLIDRPDVVAQAVANLARAGLADRVAVIGEDFFSWIPPGADAYLLSRILHNWDDQSCLSLLRAISAAATDTSRVLIVERMLRDDVAGSVGNILPALFDLHMFVMTEGRERTEEEYTQMASAAGLAPRLVTPLTLGFSLMVAVPRGAGPA